MLCRTRSSFFDCVAVLWLYRSPLSPSLSLSPVPTYMPMRCNAVRAHRASVHCSPHPSSVCFLFTCKYKNSSFSCFQPRGGLLPNKNHKITTNANEGIHSGQLPPVCMCTHSPALRLSFGWSGALCFHFSLPLFSSYSSAHFIFSFSEAFDSAVLPLN